MRLGILHDAEAQQRMHEREQRAAEEKRKKEEAPTVRTAEEQKKYDERKAQEEKDGKRRDEKAAKVKIRPLSDARAIELGANFFSEAFIFMVAVGLILLENWRSSRKSSQRRDEVSERLEALEAQVERLHQEHNLPELEALNEKIKRTREWRRKNRSSWWNPFSWFRGSDPDFDDDDDEGVPGEVEGTGGQGHAAKASGPNGTTVKDSTVAVPVEKPARSPTVPGRVDTVKADNKQR
jgi:hypothetical protein